MRYPLKFSANGWYVLAVVLGLGLAPISQAQSVHKETLPPIDVLRSSPSSRLQQATPVFEITSSTNTTLFQVNADGSLSLPTGAGAGLVLTSTADGTATWQSASGGNGSFSLPYTSTYAGTDVAFSLTKANNDPIMDLISTGTAPSLRLIGQGTGSGLLAQMQGATGQAANLQIFSSSNSSSVLFARTAGTGHALEARSEGSGTTLEALNTNLGRAGYFETSNGSNTQATLSALTRGTGNAGVFTISNTNSNDEALLATTNGTFYAIQARSTGVGSGLLVNAGSNASANSYGVRAQNSGLGIGGYFEAGNASNTNPALYGRARGTGYTAYLEGLGDNTKGLFITTTGSNLALEVDGSAQVGSLASTGSITSNSGGFVFPDGSVQSTAVSGATVGWTFAANNLIAASAAHTITNSTYTTIAGGGSSSANNRAENATSGFLGGGLGNLIGNTAAVLGGGLSNKSTGNYSVVAGGEYNEALASTSFIGGGQNNTISVDGGSGVIPGGSDNEVTAARGFAAGLRAKVNHSGSFVWNDGTTLASNGELDAGDAFRTTATNQFLLRSSGGVGININQPTAALHVAPTSSFGSRIIFGHATGTTGDRRGVMGQSDADAGFGVYGYASATTGSPAGVYGISDASAGFGVQGRADGTSATGVQGRADGTSGVGVEGTASGTSGIGGKFSGGTRGVQGTGAAYGLHGEGDEGVYGRSTDSGAIGILGAPADNANNDAGSGVYGRNTLGPVSFSDPTPIGVRGEATYGYGGFFKGADGLYATGADWGVEIESRIGLRILGQQMGAQIQTNTGFALILQNAEADIPTLSVANDAGRNENIFAAQFLDNIRVSGTVQSDSPFQTFTDHPEDPANYYLRQSTVSSEDQIAMYDGNVILDADGEAWAELPSYVSRMVTDFRYQLTCIGRPANVYIAEEVRGGRFKIAGGEPGMKVSWMLTGTRIDPAARQAAFEVKQQKPPSERGYYVHPEAYGFSQQRSITARRTEQIRKAEER